MSTSQYRQCGSSEQLRGIAAKVENAAKRLLERQRNEWVDAAAAQTTIRTDSAMAPWEKSTGPRTPAGKVRAANNAHQGGTRRCSERSRER